MQAFLGERALTTSELRAELSDIPAASLYRHVARLVGAGVLQVVAERRVRGALERTYMLRLAAASIGPDEVASMSAEDHREAFMAFVAGLLGDADRYLQRADFDLLQDGVTYRLAGLWLDDAEYADLLRDLVRLLHPRLANAPRAGRGRRPARAGAVSGADISLGTGSGGGFRLPPHLPVALLPLLALIVALDAYCLVDLARARSARGAPKIVWAIIIVFVSAPIGALVYLFAGREPRRHDPPAAASGQPGAPRPAPPALADDGAAPPPRDLPPILTTSGLTRDYGGTGLFDVDLVVPRGSIYGLVGPNGAGKTTLLSIVCGVRRSDSGAVCLDVARDKIAVCPDVPEFDGWLTAYEVVDLARALVAGSAGPGSDPGSGPGDASNAILGALRTAGIAEAVDRRVAGFSRGMVQRLGLACALVTDPELLILDEPTSALDPAGRAEMLNLVAAMRGSKTVIFSSHILADVQRVADQVGIMRDGRLLYQGSANDLIEQHLRPSWLVKITGDAAQVAQAMREQPWVAGVEPVGGGLIRVDADSIESGERGIPAVIASCGARQVSCEPVAADLESAFLALTSQPLAEAR